MTIEEVIAYFIKTNEGVVLAAKDANVYNYENQQIKAICMRRTFEANKMAIASLEAWEKVRAEIDEQYDRIKPYNIFCAEGLEMALDIIDKYKAESEDKE